MSTDETKLTLYINYNWYVCFLPSIDQLNIINNKDNFALSKKNNYKYIELSEYRSVYLKEPQQLIPFWYLLIPFCQLNKEWDYYNMFLRVALSQDCII